jgi:hypothetical protein
MISGRKNQHCTEIAVPNRNMFEIYVQNPLQALGLLEIAKFGGKNDFSFPNSGKRHAACRLSKIFLLFILPVKKADGDEC